MKSWRWSTVGAMTQPARASRKTRSRGRCFEKDGTAAGLERAIGHVDGGLEGGEARLEDEQRCVRRARLDGAQRVTEERAGLLGAHAHLGQPRAEVRQVAEQHPRVREAL